MPDSSTVARSLTIPLPRRWPRLAKQALLAAVGLERLALLEVRAGFDDSPDPAAAQTAEIDRLREQLALRDEEIRILRTRLDHVPPSRRPHYPPRERLAILELRSKRASSRHATRIISGTST